MSFALGGANLLQRLCDAVKATCDSSCSFELAVAGPVTPSLATAVALAVYRDFLVQCLAKSDINDIPPSSLSLTTTITMDDDASPYERVLKRKRDFIHQTSQTNIEVNALEAISGHKSSKDLAPWMNKVLLEHSELAHKCAALTSEINTLEQGLETSQVPPSPAQGAKGEAELLDLIIEACSNEELLRRLIARMPSIPLPFSLQKLQEQTVESLEKVKDLNEKFEELKAEHQETHARSIRFQGIVPAYTRVKRDHDRWQQEKNTAQELATAAHEATQLVEKKLQEVESKLLQVESRLENVDIKKDIALARAEAAEQDQQKALARAEEAEQQQRTTLARAEAAEQEQQKALARAEDAEQEQQATLARAKEAEKEHKEAAAHADMFKQSSAELQNQLFELRSSRKTMSGEVIELQGVRSTLEREQKNLSATTDQQKVEISGLAEQLQKLRSEVTELKNARSNLQIKLSANQTRLVCEKQNNESFREQFEEDHHTVAALQADLRRSESKLAAERLAQVTSLHRVARLDHDKSRQKSRHRRLKGKIAKLQADQAAMEVVHRKLIDRVDDLATRNDWKTRLIHRAHSCVIRLRLKITNLQVDLARHKDAVDIYQQTSDAATFKAAHDQIAINSWQSLFHALVGDVPPDWNAFQKVMAISKGMIDFPYCLSGDEWFESTSFLASSQTTVDVLHMLRCFLNDSLTFKEVRAIAESMIEFRPSTRRVILSAMFAHLQRQTDELSVENAVAMLTMQDLLHRYLLGTALGRRVRTDLAITEAMQKSPLVAGLAKWSCTGTSLVEAISAEAVRRGLSLMNNGTELVADEDRLLKITEDRKLSIVWPGEFEIVYGASLQIKIRDKIHFSWDLNNGHIDILNGFSASAIGPAVKGF